MTLAGTGNLRLIAELLCLDYETLRKYGQMSDFPDTVAILANIRIYNVSEVARYMGVPMRAK